MPLFLIDSETRVASVGFRFTDGGIDEMRLTQRIALHDPGMISRIRRSLAWLPFISAPAPERFSPIELQKDKVRLALFLQQDGFPDADVGYEVVLDTTDNAVAVTFLVTPGEPRLLDSVTVAGPDGDSLDVPAPLQSRWRDFRARLAAERGERLSDVLETRLRGRTLDFWRNHGYAFADVASRVDTTGPASRFAAILALTVKPGPYARVGSIDVEGNRVLSRRTILRELPFASGDEFDANRLAVGQSQLFGIDLVRLALISVPDSQPADSTANVRIRIEEGSLYQVEGRVGFTTEQGIAAETSWSDRDFLGGARRLTLNGRANTGWWSGQPGPNSSYNVTATLRQPWLGDYRVSGLLSPFYSYRDDLRDRSAQVGLDATVVWERGPLRTLSVSWGFANRRVYTARGGALTGTAGFLDFLRSRDTLDIDIRSSGLKSTATWGRLDDPVAPRSGWITRFGAQVTGPKALSNVQYVRLDGRVQAFLPIRSRGAVLLRGGGRPALPARLERSVRRRPGPDFPPPPRRVVHGRRHAERPRLGHRPARAEDPRHPGFDGGRFHRVRDREPLRAARRARPLDGLDRAPARDAVRERAELHPRVPRRRPRLDRRPPLCRAGFRALPAHARRRRPLRRRRRRPARDAGRTAPPLARLQAEPGPARRPRPRRRRPRPARGDPDRGRAHPRRKTLAVAPVDRPIVLTGDPMTSHETANGHTDIGIRRIAWRTLEHWLGGGIMHWGASLSYYTLFSMAPLLVFITGTAGMLFDASVTQTEILSQLRIVLGPRGADIAATVLHQASFPGFGSLASAALAAALDRRRDRRVQQPAGRAQ